MPNRNTEKQVPCPLAGKCELVRQFCQEPNSSHLLIQDIFQMIQHILDVDQFKQDARKCALSNPDTCWLSHKNPKIKNPLLNMTLGNLTD